jgi:NitT/TauT family transport system substrate-binding protein
LTACQPARLIRRDPSRRLVLRINIFGTTPFAPLLQMRERRLLEEAVPGMIVEWKSIPAVDAVNEALRDGGLDMATGSPTSLLLAREVGLAARVIGGISAIPCAVIGKPGLRSLTAIKQTDRIVVPEESGLEASILQLAALREFGDARALDQNVAYGSHLDALPALKQGKEFAAHVSMTPFLELELEGAGPERLIDSRELFGGTPTSALAYALPSLRERAAPLIEAFTEMLAEGARLAAADPVGTARLLSETEDLRIAPERLGALLERSGWQLGAPPLGVTRLAELWQRTDRLRQSPTAWSALAFDGVAGG